MPYKFIPAPPLAEYLEHLAAVAEELRLRQPDGPEDAPLIIEEHFRRHEMMSVKVLWDRWKGIPLEDRSRVIMDAYYKVRGAEAVLKLTPPLGLTHAEARRLGVEAAR